MAFMSASLSPFLLLQKTPPKGDSQVVNPKEQVCHCNHCLFRQRFIFKKTRRNMLKQPTRRLLFSTARRRLLAARLPTNNAAASSSARCLSSVPQPLLIEKHDDPHAEAWKAKKESLKLLLQKTTKKNNRRTQIDSENEDNDMDVSTSPSELKYTGNAVMPITTQLHLVKSSDDTPRGIWPVYRLMDENGTFRDGSTDAYEPEAKQKANPIVTSVSVNGTHDLDKIRRALKEEYPLHAGEFEESSLLLPSKHNYADTNSDNTLMRAYRQMIRLREMDTILQNAQRQGRISFYMTCHGEEAIHIGSAAALTLDDTVLAQYREAGVLMWRGFTLEQFTNQCFSNEADLGKGRQMPVHYGSRALNYQTISSPLGTQIPQAAGAAYRLKISGKKGVAICFFGDGCASTTDFHSGLNFAATLGAPVIFFCRNNGYAISTPVTDQYAGDGIVSRGPGYGIASIRIDGNDIFAVNSAVREARKYALENNAPVLIEAMSYRQGHHSTSDDSLRYRSAGEVKSFADTSDPLKRVEAFLQRQDLLSESENMTIKDEEKMAVIESMRKAERLPKPGLEDLFEDVYHEVPASLMEQQRQLYAHLAKYKGKY